MAPGYSLKEGAGDTGRALSVLGVPPPFETGKNMWEKVPGSSPPRAELYPCLRNVQSPRGVVGSLGFPG